MTRYWVTSMSTNPESVVNPLIAACEDGYVPTAVHLLSNPTVEFQLEMITELVTMVLTAYGESDTTVEVKALSHETDFDGIIEHFYAPIREATDTDDVAIDVTPGRKFMSAIAFQVGMKHEATHVYYNHVASTAYFGKVHSTIPRTATDLIDFRALFPS
ncbi:PDDEXK family nuclease [Salinigranum halophilum]|uniref:hypothetical protein n=1 Tax=Salinigranum halophilum TaxID=2565931 RepID=UPI0010A8EB9B|nr:hypothetical protein [Salinigranum halophilum]